ncbi:hypothetical protein [Marinobacter lutaoensis]|uniref:hypothetical protein n=1 Tax=Marinobacter lutaoensis TaxID=135739 RepID=UPI0011157135|nr:hypothetical protein [Marinobacter lutaoensis]
MISNPKTSADFDKEIEATLRRDVDSVVIGGALQRPASASLIEDTGHTVHIESVRITLPLLKIQPVRNSSPARYEYYRKLITSHPGSQLPRSKVIRRRNFGHLVAINMPPA